MRLRSAPRKSMSSLPDAWRNSRTAAAPFSVLLPTRTTPTPAWASTRAIALPIPSVPPVTSAIRRSRGSLLGIIMYYLRLFGLQQPLGQTIPPVDLARVRQPSGTFSFELGSCRIFHNRQSLHDAVGKSDQSTQAGLGRPELRPKPAPPATDQRPVVTHCLVIYVRYTF